MLQFNYSGSGTKTVAQWSDEKYTDTTVTYIFTSSFSGQRTQFDATITSNTTKDTLGGWLLIQNQNKFVPQESGQYILNIYQVASGSGNPEWIYAIDAWSNENETWEDYQGATSQVGDLITTNRAFVSGSDFDTIYKYSYQDEPIYSVYNG